MSKPPTYDRDVGKNWHLRFRLIIQELTEEEQSRVVQDSRIVVFELLTRRFGYGLLELRGDTLYPLELKLDYSIPLQSNPISEFY